MPFAQASGVPSIESMSPHFTVVVIFPRAGHPQTRRALAQLEADLGVHSGQVALAFLIGNRVHLELSVRDDVDLTRVQGRVAESGGFWITRERLGGSALDRYVELCESSERKVGPVPGLVAALDLLLGRSDADRAVCEPSIRFALGDRWANGRLLSLHARGARIAATAGFCVGDRTRVVLQASGRPVEVAARVAAVTEAPAGQRGVSGFSLSFEDVDDPGGRLALRRAAEQLRHLEPPPARRESRYHLDWPVVIESQGAQPARLRNVSRSGLMLECDAAVPRAERLLLRIPCDRREMPVHVEARVVRLGEERVLGLQLAQNPDGRFEDFVQRVASRGEKRILVGAKGGRLEPIVKEFASSGYAPRGATNARMVWRYAVDGEAPPDLVITHSSLGETGVHALRTKLEARKIEVLKTSSSPLELRRLVDAALVA
jgi:hypothetical protein